MPYLLDCFTLENLHKSLSQEQAEILLRKKHHQ